MFALFSLDCNFKGKKRTIKQQAVYCASQKNSKKQNKQKNGKVS